MLKGISFTQVIKCQSALSEHQTPKPGNTSDNVLLEKNHKVNINMNTEIISQTCRGVKLNRTYISNVLIFLPLQRGLMSHVLTSFNDNGACQTNRLTGLMNNQ